MASNTQTIGGFQPVRSKIAKTQGRIQPFTVANNSSLTTNNFGDIYVGDAVTLSSGLVAPAYTGQTILGVAVGFGVTNPGDPLSAPLAFNYNNPSNSPGYAPLVTTSGLTVFVALAADWIFKVQSAVALNYYVGSTADINVSGNTIAHGSETTGQSSEKITTSSSADVTIIENLYLVNNVHNSAYEQYLVAFKTYFTI